MPERRIILHVGMHKTGTSSIQASLHAARGALLKANIVYAPFGRNHSVALHDAFGEAEVTHRRHLRRGAATEDDPQDRGRGVRQRLKSAFSENPTADFVISGEDISGFSEAETRRMLAFLRRFFPRIELVFFARPPASFIHSQAQQQIRSGMTLPRLMSNTFQVRYRRFRKYYDLLPREAIVLRVFARGQLVDGCAVKTFCAATDLPDVPVIRANESLSRKAADFLLVANEVVPPRLPNGRPNPERAPGLRLAKLDGPKFYAPLEVVQRGLQASRLDIAWMNRVLGHDIEAHDDTPAPDAHHPGRIPPARWSTMKEHVLARNRKLLDGKQRR